MRVTRAKLLKRDIKFDVKIKEYSIPQVMAPGRAVAEPSGS